MVEQVTKNIKIVSSETSDTRGLFTLAPLAPGMSFTIGNSIRRILLAFSEGYAITGVSFSPSVAHEFANIEGVVEDMAQIILNLKKIRLKKVKDTEEEKIGVPFIPNKDGTFTGAQLAEASGSFEVLNPEQIICHLDKKVSMQMEIAVAKNFGYVPIDEMKSETQVFGFFEIDAMYSPVINVNFTTEDMLVGGRTDYQKILLDIETNGTVTPKEALDNAIKSLRDIYTNLSNEEIKDAPSHTEETAAVEKDKLRINKLLDTPLSKLNDSGELSARVVNSLHLEGINYLRDILGKSINDLLAYENFGKKCAQDIEAFLNKKKISLDMKIVKQEQ